MKTLYQKIAEGQQGKNKALSFGMPTFDSLYGGIRKQSSVLIGGTPGAGKTTFTDRLFLYPSIMHALQGKNVRVEYFSFDVNRDETWARMLLNQYYQSYKKAIPGGIMDLMGYRFPKSKLTDKQLSRIDDLQAKFSEMDQVVRLHTRPSTPEAIVNRLRKVTVNMGKAKKNSKGIIVGAELPEDTRVVAIVDHASKINGRGGEKERIDTLSRMVNEWRSNFDGTFVLVQQMRHDAASPERRKTGEFFPIASDFKSSTNPHEDFMISFGLFQPSKVLKAMRKDIELMQDTYLNGITTQLYDDVLTTVTNLKNRTGPEGRTHLMAFLKPMFYMEEWSSHRIKNYIKWQQLIDEQSKKQGLVDNEQQ